MPLAYVLNNFPPALMCAVTGIVTDVHLKSKLQSVV